MTTYTWKVSQLERESSDGYVFTAHWTVNATETVEDKTYSAGAYGSIGFERPEEEREEAQAVIDATLQAVIDAVNAEEQ